MKDDDDDVGYGKPPKKHRFKPGQSGNLTGRPKKKKPDEDLRAMLERISAEEVEVGGRTMTLHEVELRALHHKAARGDVTASRHLMKLRELAGFGQPEKATGVLLIPSHVPIDEWSAAAARQQAQFREKIPDDEDVRDLP